MKKQQKGRRVPKFGRIDIEGQLWTPDEAGLLEWYQQRWDCIDEAWKEREWDRLMVDLYFSELWDEWEDYQDALADKLLDEFHSRDDDFQAGS